MLQATGQRAFAKRTWPEVDRTLAELANAASADDAHRAALIIRRAQLLESRQQRPDQAAELYETALQVDPSAGIAIQALKRLYYGQHRWRDLIRTLEAEAELATAPAAQASSLSGDGSSAPRFCSCRWRMRLPIHSICRSAPSGML